MIVYRVLLSNYDLYIGSCEECRRWVDIQTKTPYIDFSTLENSIPKEYEGYSWEILEQFIPKDNLQNRVNYWKSLLYNSGGYIIHA